MTEGEFDEQLDRVFAQLRAIGAAGEAVQVGEMELTLEATPTAPSIEAGLPPAPGDWHPYYEDHGYPYLNKRWLLHWLDHEPDKWHVELPIRPVSRPIIDSSSPYPDPRRRNILTKQRAWGAAPYIGRPFVYTWWCASDEHGRWIAGETTTIAYTTEER